MERTLFALRDEERGVSHTPQKQRFDDKVRSGAGRVLPPCCQCHRAGERGQTAAPCLALPHPRKLLPSRPRVPGSWLASWRSGRTRCGPSSPPWLASPRRRRTLARVWSTSCGARSRGTPRPPRASAQRQRTGARTRTWAGRSNVRVLWHAPFLVPLRQDRPPHGRPPPPTSARRCRVRAEAG